LKRSRVSASRSGESWEDFRDEAADAAVTEILYPETRPHAEGMLDVGDGNRMRWAAYGSPSGKPAAVVHGGPGSGSNPGLVSLFNPSRYRVVLFDQRGCGGSTPHASDPATEMRHNTTAHLIADMERLREHLDIDRWLLLGGSWGSTLTLAYAERTRTASQKSSSTASAPLAGPRSTGFTVASPASFLRLGNASARVSARPTETISSPPTRV
jgi:pimeloyl-ACP methyl ester carboxylesterase